MFFWKTTCHECEAIIRKDYNRQRPLMRILCSIDSCSRYLEWANYCGRCWDNKKKDELIIEKSEVS